MSNTPSQDKFTHLLPVGLALICVLIALGGNDLAQVLRYERTPIMEGELWRLLSGQLTHLGWSHLLLNVMGLALIWGLLGGAFTLPAWGITTLVSALAVSAGLLAFNPEIIWYVGLSGLLHGLFVAGTISDIRRGDRHQAILLAAIVAKLLWEQSFGALPGTAEMANGPVIVDAHLYGALAGALCGMLLRPRLWC